MTREKRFIEFQRELLELQGQRQDIVERHVELVNEKIDILIGSTNDVVSLLLDEYERLSRIVLLLADSVQPGIREMIEDVKCCEEREKLRSKLKVVK